MLFNFDKIEEVAHHEFKGGNKDTLFRMYTDPKIKIARGRLEPGASIGMHIHEKNSEAILILEGEAKILYDDGVEFLSPGQCHYCPSGHSHSLINNGQRDLIFFAVIPEHEA